MVIRYDFDQIEEEIEVREQEAENARAVQKVLEWARNVCGALACVLATGLDRGNWMLAFLLLMVMVLAAITCHVLSLGWKDVADEFEGVDYPWERR